MCMVCMYVHVAIHKYIHTDTDGALGTAATYQHRKVLGSNQELTEQVGCLWFHDISFTEAEKFYKNNLDKVSCDFFPLMV